MVGLDGQKVVVTGWRCSASCWMGRRGHVGLLLRGREAGSGAGRCCEAGSITPHTQLRVRCTSDQEEAAAYAFFKGYRPQFTCGRRT